MRPEALRDLLIEFYRDKLASILRHQDGARFIGQYDFNNTYQYIIGREETQLAWVGAAIADLAGTLPDAGALPPPPLPEGKGDARQRAIIDDAAKGAQAFVDRWRPRIDVVTNARHKGMLRVILGETMEQKRFFDQMLEGRTDLLGKHSDGAGTRGSVISTRWIE